MVQLLAECFATCILILIGEAGLANYKFAQQTSHSTLPIAIAFSVGVYSAMMVSGPITDVHLNPAISISLMTIGKLKSFQCIFYIIGQILGAFLGAALVYLVYWNQFNIFDVGIRQMTGPNGIADIFFTMPGKGIPHRNTFIDQVISTCFLMIFVMALTQARDLGPRLFGAFIYGWNNVFRVHNYFFWVPIIGPIVGGILGVWIYTGFTWIIKHYCHFSNIERTDANKSNDKDIHTNEDDSLGLQQKLTAMDG